MVDHKKKYSQFFTDPALAEYMVKEVLHEGAKTFLDPAVGMGIFTKYAAALTDAEITACEIDPGMAERFREDNRYPVRVITGDYLEQDFPEKFDCIVCNPPYSKFQVIEKRDRYRENFRERYSVNIGGYSNLCVYFLVKSLSELNRRGRCCYIMPYEFLNTGYGREIKEYLLRSKMLVRIIKLNCNIKVFDDAVTTSCILLLENENHNEVEFVTADSVEELTGNTFSNVMKYRYSELEPKRKWLSYFGDAGSSHYDNIVKVSAFGKVSRGIATGANEFFALSLPEIQTRGLSEDACMPCIIKTPDIKQCVITDPLIRELVESNRKMFLFDGTKARTEGDFAYIRYGEEQGYHMRYLTRNRKPWYTIENKAAAPILISVFNRNKIKVVRNEAGIKNLTAFHGLYLKDADEDFTNIFFCYLITPLAQELLHRSRRECGEGLDMFEPGDLTRADMLDLRLISEADREEIRTIYRSIRAGKKPGDIEKLDGLFRKYIK